MVSVLPHPSPSTTAFNTNNSNSPALRQLALVDEDAHSPHALFAPKADSTSLNNSKHITTTPSDFTYFDIFPYDADPFDDSNPST